MSKSSLIPPLDVLESQIIETLLAGHHEYRPDLGYPESHSDMQGAVRGLLRMFEVKRRPMAVALEYPCRSCNGVGHFRSADDIRDTCKNCNGTGKIKEKKRVYESKLGNG